MKYRFIWKFFLLRNWCYDYELFKWFECAWETLMTNQRKAYCRNVRGRASSVVHLGSHGQVTRPVTVDLHFYKIFMWGLSKNGGLSQWPVVTTLFIKDRIHVTESTCDASLDVTMVKVDSRSWLFSHSVHLLYDTDTINQTIQIDNIKFNIRLLDYKR